jgi:hypothetical protein
MPDNGLTAELKQNFIEHVRQMELERTVALFLTPLSLALMVMKLRVRFTIRDLLWLTFVVAGAMAILVATSPEELRRGVWQIALGIGFIAVGVIGLKRARSQPWA